MSPLTFNFRGDHSDDTFDTLIHSVEQQPSLHQELRVVREKFKELILYMEIILRV